MSAHEITGLRQVAVACWGLAVWALVMAGLIAEGVRSNWRRRP